MSSNSDTKFNIVLASETVIKSQGKYKVTSLAGAKIQFNNSYTGSSINVVEVEEVGRDKQDATQRAIDTLQNLIPEINCAIQLLRES